MARYHINPNTDEPGICRAHSGRCPFGSADEHFDSPEAARVAFEQSNSGRTFTKAVKRVERDVAIEANPSDFDSVAVPDFSRVGRAVSAGARGLLSGFVGGKTYEKTIADAKERANYATAYYDRKNLKNERQSSFLESNARVASASVASRTKDALGAARSARVAADASRIAAYTSVSSNPDSVKNALAARGSSSSKISLGSAAAKFSW